MGRLTVGTGAKPMEALPEKPPVPMGETLVGMVRAGVESFCAASGAACELRDELFHLRFGDATYVLGNGGLTSDRLRLTLGAYLRGQATGPGFADVLASIHGTRRLIVTERRLQGLFERARGDVRVPVEIRRGSYLFGEPHTGWRTSHEYTSWVETLGVLDARGLPGDDDGSAKVLATLVTAMVPPPRTGPVNAGGECRFCHRTFAARDYLLHERCCHGCAVSKLGVVF